MTGEYMKNEKIIRAFNECGIYELAFAKTENLTVTKEYLLPKEMQTAIVFLIPYYTGNADGNISLYARAEDYHFVAKEISEKVISVLSAEYPKAHFANFADHSPIAECEAAAKLSLGVIGKNHLLINKRYGSFVFVSTLFCDIDCDYDEIREIKTCLCCGKCEKACPTKALSSNDMKTCLSYITQKKGELSEFELKAVKESKTVWGCDICQLSCPMNKNIEITPLDVFNKNRIESLYLETLENMTDEEFNKRAFSFRGKTPLIRNLKLQK